MNVKQHRSIRCTFGVDHVTMAATRIAVITTEITIVPSYAIDVKRPHWFLRRITPPSAWEDIFNVRSTTTGPQVGVQKFSPIHAKLTQTRGNTHTDIIIITHYSVLNIHSMYQACACRINDNIRHSHL